MTAPALGPPAPLNLPLPPVSTTPAGVQVRRGIVYASPDGFRPLELDLYQSDGGARPDAGQPDDRQPLIVFVHGGGWRLGTRRSFGPVLDRLSPNPFERLAQAGFTVASVDYRLSGEAVFPAQLDDVVLAVAYLRARAAELRADPDRVVLWGESAGGHLAALAGLVLTDDGSGNGVCGVVDWYGPSDLAAMPGELPADAITDPGAPGSRESLLLGRPLLEAGDLAVAASPALRVHPQAPPFFLAHGTRDRFVPAAQSVRLHDALTQQGVSAQLHLVEGADHLWLGAPDPERQLDAALAFARDQTDPAHAHSDQRPTGS